ncbi:MAG: YraN family protein [Anaerolineales bacterium]|nr:YraN family protein [Anaerolineales bacterium]
MSCARIGLGRRGEALAAEKLTALGYQIVARNYRCPTGEIDLVARCGPAWVFVEVRTRRGVAFGTPEESLTPRKRRHLLTAAQTYLQEHALENVDWRVDLVAVQLTERGELLRVEVVENVVSGSE